ncbi:hypothetical protein N473_08210 [Pseudoalteromonas luteoviolacea CPMOR-1]|uniref:Uncharacterized protein n=1 Tax=Pseudoalteromonas luteoviolacea CPMOR-1 TaxID=1365248 RepID=A0A162B6D0_9GAMM|nr:hypothetical protein [Pseudoalteromonas luteoviolacea]KZN67195.1 hypothetical protein N473_08210 [Pseudoalteromonas luteoviolacea CPMOR-1]
MYEKKLVRLKVSRPLGNSKVGSNRKMTICKGHLSKGKSPVTQRVDFPPGIWNGLMSATLDGIPFSFGHQETVQDLINRVAAITGQIIRIGNGNGFPIHGNNGLIDNYHYQILV